MPIPVVIDTDPGTDDAIALIMAAASPELDIRGLTTVAGNANIADTTRNTLALMESLGRVDVPVSVGAGRPLVGEFTYAYHYHGSGGLTVDLPQPEMEPTSTPAPEFLRESAARHAGDLTVIALGPLTNIALAIREDDGVRGLIRRIVVMGGAVETAGNVTPYAEFNIYDDPHAANIVFGSGIPVLLVGLDVGKAVSFGRNDTDWRSGDTRGERLAASVIDGWFRQHPDGDEYVLCDPLTVAATIEEDLFEYRRAEVVVDEEGETRGMTRARYGVGSIDVAVSVADHDRARGFVLDRLRTRV